MAKKSTKEVFISKAIIIHGNKYDYSGVVYENNNTKVAISCKKHGQFLQTPVCHLQGKGCPMCAGNKPLDTESFIIKARLIHGDSYDYSKVLYVGNKIKIAIICPIHGEFFQRPDQHLRGKGCLKCGNLASGSKRKLTTQEFISRASKVHNNKYNYTKVAYINGSEKVTIICPIHGEFTQTPFSHLCGSGCKKCSIFTRRKFLALSTLEFISKAIKIHGNKYDYSKVNYKTNYIKVVIVCKAHGEFLQVPNSHLSGNGCPKCNNLNKLGDTNPNWKGGVSRHLLNLPLHDTYVTRLEQYHTVYRVEKYGLNLLGVECLYCGNVFIPTINAVSSRLFAINNATGENNFYCSDNCKKSCPTYGKKLYPEGTKPATSREVQPELRKLVLARDNYKCQICEAGLEEAELHCHHIEAVSLNPIESADMDNCAILCIDCHKKAHELPGCSYNELKCKKINEAYR